MSCRLFVLSCLVVGLMASMPVMGATSLPTAEPSQDEPLTAPNPPPKPADDTSRQKDLLRKSLQTVESLLSDPDYPSLLNLATRAKAILVVPSLLKLSFFLGGHGGSGVLLSRGADGKWSNPAFYTIGGINYGFQLGGQSSELILTIMSEKGLKALLDHELTLGADAGASIGTIGRGARAATGLGQDADVYAFARSEGLYAGISLDGTVITPDGEWNEAFYGKGATPEAILIERRFKNAEADKLLAAMP